MNHSPLSQFEIKSIYDFFIFGIKLSITNIGLILAISTFSCIAFLYFSMKKSIKSPSYSQILIELIYNAILDMVGSTIGLKKGKNFIPIIFTVFCFILSCNFFGMLPYSFASTSHISITLSISCILFLIIIISGFAYNGLRFFKIFLPPSCPYWLAPLMILIEFFSFLSKPFSLSIRLAANITSGHVLLHVISSTLLAQYFFPKLVAFPFMMIIIAFELCVSLLQAYIFSVLTCVYISDVLDLH